MRVLDSKSVAIWLDQKHVQMPHLYSGIGLCRSWEAEIEAITYYDYIVNRYASVLLLALFLLIFNLLCFIVMF